VWMVVTVAQSVIKGNLGTRAVRCVHILHSSFQFKDFLAWEASILIFLLQSPRLKNIKYDNHNTSICK
jgi:hypothetical protein